MSIMNENLVNLHLQFCDRIPFSFQLNSTVWLNADVLSGPVNSPTSPVQDEIFLTLCQTHFPTATVSIGWTTHWYPTFTEDTWHYGWQHVRRMADLIRCKGYDNKYPKFTFPVRGIFASRSIRQLQWLLRIIPSSTLTVWTGQYDPLQVEDLLQIRSAFPKDRVYYDIPEHINAPFNEKKNAVDLPTYSFNEDGSQWMTLTKGQGTSCSALTYIKSDAIVFGKSLTTAVLQKSLIVLKGKDSLKITGKIKFFDTDEPWNVQTRAGVQELAIVLADVSLFSKNMSGDSRQELDLTSSDTEVIWSAINSSIIYTFRHKHKRGQRQSEEKSCRLFKLDTSEDKSFEVWTVPCDVTHEESSFEELVRNGIPEISSRKRLVLPRNPFMLGFVSSGEEHVAIYDLKFKGHKKAFTSGSSTLTMPLGLFLMIFSLFCKMVFDML